MEISIEQWDALVGIVADYTNKLAEANSVEFGDLESTAHASGAGRVIELRHYLEAQREIFEQSA